VWLNYNSQSDSLAINFSLHKKKTFVGRKLRQQQRYSTLKIYKFFICHPLPASISHPFHSLYGTQFPLVIFRGFFFIIILFNFSTLFFFFFIFTLYLFILCQPYMCVPRVLCSVVIPMNMNYAKIFNFIHFSVGMKTCSLAYTHTH